jgi:hypothetical protein
MWRLFISLAVLTVSTVAYAGSLRDLVRDNNIQTHSVTRKGQDIYESVDGYLITTKYCYEYIYYQDVFFSGGKMYIVDSGNSCQVDKIYRK